jgi:lipopolysaccharide transport system permease protein
MNRTGEIRLAPSSGWASINFSELWRGREVLAFLVWRDVKVRYKQTALGIMWALVQPLAATAVFALIFGRLAGLPSEGVSYPLFVLAGMGLWTFFANGITAASMSLVVNEQLVRKVYFPRLFIPAASVLAGLVDFLLFLAVLFVVVIIYGGSPEWSWLLIPLVIFITTLAGLAVGTLLAAINARYRDVQHVVPFLTQIWLFATPIVYASSLFAEPWRTLMGVNPMAGTTELFRALLFGTPAPMPLIALSVATTLLMAAAAGLIFKRVERTMADVL